MNNTRDNHNSVKDDSVVTLDYTLEVDGGVVDTSNESEPIQFIQGQGQILPGLERQLYGMKVGESKNVVLSPSEGYGELDAEAFADIPRSEFPPQIPLETGVTLQLRDQEGQVMDAYIAGIFEDTIRLNFNHPLAGKELHFSVKVLDLREATEDEIEHGHIHGIEGQEDEEEWEDEAYLEIDDEDLDEEDEWEDEDEEA